MNTITTASPPFVASCMIVYLSHLPAHYILDVNLGVCGNTSMVMCCVLCMAIAACLWIRVGVHGLMAVLLDTQCYMLNAYSFSHNS